MKWSRASGRGVVVAGQARVREKGLEDRDEKWLWSRRPDCPGPGKPVSHSGIMANPPLSENILSLVLQFPPVNR